MFPLNSETDEDEGDDIRIMYTRMVKGVDKEKDDESKEEPVSVEDLEPITNPFYAPALLPLRNTGILCCHLAGS